MMKKIIFFLGLGCSLFTACQPSVEASTAYNVAGVYQLVGYTTPTIGDDNPTGTVSATQIDGQHVNLVVKGTSGKVKITYLYNNVYVVSASQAIAGQDTYSLLYKGHQIGVAGNDAISRYVELYPSTTITLKGIEF
ncbi:hypothetical protein EXU85_13610 [Spirosoma sp. KCTC 42546]|uniref:hypothetical protein n=1 Tax=Spirosoma sp. KCTC 42546 TaxID=2520506 RepID=UPI00115B5070|nr:hypothetical protein [Spirosoma sp. KCTC 42546]QDK79583.1 hypothetical protein EXU85_13610 [Spirosoma sp. KCTC 42546]